MCVCADGVMKSECLGAKVECINASALTRAVQKEGGDSGARKVRPTDENCGQVVQKTCVCVCVCVDAVTPWLY